MQYRDPIHTGEIFRLIEKQIETLERETFGGVTNAERRDYEERQDRIDALCRELTHFSAA